MIIYHASKAEFSQDVLSNQIDSKVQKSFKRKLGYRPAPGEIRSWANSLLFMNNVLATEGIPETVNVAVEYKVPLTGKRIDFIVSGKNLAQENSLVIVELKQWTTAEKTSKDGVVKTFVGGSEREVSHPSYQAWVYASLLKEYNTAVQDQNILLNPCAYLHNCENGSELLDSFYGEHTEKAPLFLRGDTEKLQQFIKNNIKYGDDNGLLYQIDNGKIRPSKKLADQLVSMLQGKNEFLMVDDQKIVFESAMHLAEVSDAKNKNVLIVEGGPGTGKSVVAINLLVHLTQNGLLAQYLSKNAAPRTVYEKKLTGSFRKSHISNLFSGSGSFTKAEKNTFDVLIADEAHRLMEKSGLYGNLGENQIKEIINSSLLSVFFIDENQKVTFKDVGSKEEIEKWAKRAKCTVHSLELASQFRCNGSDGYLAWLDNTLQIKETAHPNLSGVDYTFEVLDSPEKLRDTIFQLNGERNSARLVAGYCWEWRSKKNPQAFDIELGQSFRMKWNLTAHGAAWMAHPDSVTEAGCIHTCQGLEVDHIGVIIGDDLIVRDGSVITNGLARARSDQSIKGFKSLLKRNPAEAQNKVDLIIKNTYRTLMTRGMKSCFIYCTDDETREYFRSRLGVSYEPGRLAGTSEKIG